MSKYDELRNSLKEAVKKAEEVAQTTDDGGTCNFDCCLLFLPRYNEEKTIEAIQAAGVGGSKVITLEKFAICLVIPFLHKEIKERYRRRK